MRTVGTVDRPLRLSLSYVAPSDITTQAPVVRFPTSGYYCLPPPCDVHGIFLLPVELARDQEWRRYVLWLPCHGGYVAAGDYYMLGPWAVYLYGDDFATSPPSGWGAQTVTISPGRTHRLSLWRMYSPQERSTTSASVVETLGYIYVPAAPYRSGNHDLGICIGIWSGAPNEYWEARALWQWYTPAAISIRSGGTTWNRWAAATYDAYMYADIAARVQLNYRTTDTDTPQTATSSSVAICIGVIP